MRIRILKSSSLIPNNLVNVYTESMPKSTFQKLVRGIGISPAQLPWKLSCSWLLGKFLLLGALQEELPKVPNTAASGDGSSNVTFFRAVLLVRRGRYDEAREYVERARKCLATELAALMDTSEDFESIFLEILHREICVGQSLQVQSCYTKTN
ncbi:uncharacterized protein LOC126612702 [Malus sylvestris]|uniref:uncharacterized protein LOC126612702 n=1 Tax=Malus sylvestris TaxID=3752 RepID=UPI0021AC903A|nr:uncharacterized protein LOC126612702 [Malus sylvestris]